MCDYNSFITTVQRSGLGHANPTFAKHSNRNMIDPLPQKSLGHFSSK